MESKKDVTLLLAEWNQGDRAALEQLMPLVYDELHSIAHRHLRRNAPSSTLQTTALIHEAYLRLVDQTQVRWESRAHFFGAAAKIMRHIVIDHARKNLAEKRGGQIDKISLDENVVDVSNERSTQLIALNEALERLDKEDEQKASLVELRYFGGLSIEETAEVMQVSAATVVRQWRIVKAWLYKELSTVTSDK